MDRLRDNKSYGMHMCKNAQGGDWRTYLMQCQQRKHNQSVREGERERKERKGDRQTEMTSWHGFFFQVQWGVGYSCRATSVCCAVAESAPWWNTDPNSRQFLCLNTSEEHPEKLANQSMVGQLVDVMWKKWEHQNIKHLFHQRLWWWRLALNQIQQIASKDAVFVPHLPYIRKQRLINGGLVHSKKK